ncbi:MAG: hypothetical protein KJ558_10905 [Gammaproteobacteria bacterium]|nr:hypothetical protein [Gammaproteobacteria bacterium]MBU1655317.1 hypothetical protein [Gammaproteobacteria bacterium]MBU1961462.1 hypothetical protein [Gammaproteobacteria bacterium]
MPPAPPCADPEEMALFLAESSRLMEVTQTYLTHALRDGQQAVDRLAGVFTDIHEQLHPALTEGVEARLRQAIVQLQFYDRLSQRVGHVQSTLVEYQQLMARPDEAGSAACWRGFWQRMAASYPNAEDRRLLMGANGDGDRPVEEPGDCSDVELF